MWNKYSDGPSQLINKSSTFDMFHHKKIWAAFFYYFINLLFLLAIIGCKLQPVAEIDLVGKYEGIVPHGGLEVLELKSDGVCIQCATFDDGTLFSATGTWKYIKYPNAVELRGINQVVEYDGAINPNLWKKRDIVRIMPISRNLSGKIMIGVSEDPDEQWGIYYKK